MRIINLTKNPATREQERAGVVDVERDRVKFLNHFDKETELSRAFIRGRANSLALIADLKDADAAMIGGEPLMVAELELALRQLNIKILYNYNGRVVEVL